MKIWKTISKIKNYKTADLLKNLKNKNFKTSAWIDDIFDKKNMEIRNIKLPINLYRISLKDLGLNEPTELKKIYETSKSQGFKLIDPKLVLICRELYLEQPTGEWLRFATPLDSMIDSDGVPHLPKLGKGLGKLFIETYWSYPEAIFHPHNDFIVKK